MLNVLAKIGLALFALSFLSLQPKAQEVEFGSGLVCDTANQVSSFLAKSQADPQASIDAVNLEANDPTACIVGSFAFYKGAATDTVRNEKGAWAVTEILVIAVMTPRGWQRINPHAYWSAFLVKEVPA